MELKFTFFELVGISFLILVVTVVCVFFVNQFLAKKRKRKGTTMIVTTFDFETDPPEDLEFIICIDEFNGRVFPARAIRKSDKRGGFKVKLVHENLQEMDEACTRYMKMPKVKRIV